MSFFSLFAGFMLILFVSCADDDSASSSSPAAESSSRTIVAFYSPNGIGDLSYEDAISLALHKTALAHDFNLIENCPENWEYADMYADINFTTIPAEKRLYIFCDTGYRSILEKYRAQIETNGKDVLMFDSRNVNLGQNIHTVCLPLYGIAYEAGVLARELVDENDMIDIIIGDGGNSLLEDATIAFMEGLGERNGSTEILTLNELSEMSETDGYNMSSYLYWNYTTQITEKRKNGTGVASLILPLCGGSIHGIFRWNRDYGDESSYTIGMDTDMSAYTNRVPYSLVKNFTPAFELCLGQWIKGELPQHQTLGLKDGFTELVLSPAFKDRLEEKLSEIHHEAIEKEENYEADK